MSSRSCGADGGAGRGVWEVVATGLSLRAQNVSRSRSSRKVTAVPVGPTTTRFSTSTTSSSTGSWTYYLLLLLVLVVLVELLVLVVVVLWL